MKIALIGLGTTGNIVAEYLYKENVLSMVLCREGSANEGLDLGQILHRPHMGITVESTADLEAKLKRYQPDVLIDFSGPSFLREHISTLAKCNVNVVTAVTAYSQMDIKRIKVFARQGAIGVVSAPNITYGVNVMILMAELAAQLQSDYDFQIIEENHRNKKDSPSGTAEKLAAAIMRTWEKNGENEETSVPIHSIRAGDVAGRHKVLVYGKYDQIEITHTAFSRMAFAEGAYKAACFIQGRSGYYEMRDVFGLGKQATGAERGHSLQNPAFAGQN